MKVSTSKIRDQIRKGSGLMPTKTMGDSKKENSRRFCRGKVENEQGIKVDKLKKID